MNLEDRIHIHELILSSGMALDERRFEDYLALYAEAGEYLVTAHVPETASLGTWMDLDKDNLRRLLESADRHTWNTGERLHQISAPVFTLEAGEVRTISVFSVFRIDEVGESRLYAVGHYHDTWVRTDRWLLKRRVARLASRHLTPPSAMPL